MTFMDYFHYYSIYIVKRMKYVPAEVIDAVVFQIVECCSISPTIVHYQQEIEHDSMYITENINR